ncbi:uncharacterized protein LOC111697673 [Eurytemora carolleeae]|uniref:uncharacterized protein LOC111697673 n=1 Tax=Eurytemora carolleeae TaxID=1294199 RepID=UPI000C77BB91|nr:uncharacterized protein LOC111697673 [Eurytemora carolleeae]|eukprot:XP_023323521.1 uncharacterized protein LOC111697673 [Eurytemora affinis]
MSGGGSSLRVNTRGELAFRKHLAANKKETVESRDISPAKYIQAPSWSFPKLEYSSRIHLEDQTMPESKWGLRDQEKKHQEARRREILVLIHHHLVEEGLKEAADILGTQ